MQIALTFESFAVILLVFKSLQDYVVLRRSTLSVIHNYSGPVWVYHALQVSYLLAFFLQLTLDEQCLVEVTDGVGAPDKEISSVWVHREEPVEYNCKHGEKDQNPEDGTTEAHRGVDHEVGHPIRLAHCPNVGVFF